MVAVRAKVMIIKKKSKVTVFASFFVSLVLTFHLDCCKEKSYISTFHEDRYIVL